MLGYAVAAAEALGYDDHLFVVPAAYVTKKNSWWSPERAYYLNGNEEHVPAFEFPKTPLFKKLLYGAKPYPIPTMVRSSRKKDYLVPIDAEYTLNARTPM